MNKRLTFSLLALIVVFAMTLSACGSAATPAPTAMPAPTQAPAATDTQRQLRFPQLQPPHRLPHQPYPRQSAPSCLMLPQYQPRVNLARRIRPLPWLSSHRVNLEPLPQPAMPLPTA